MDLVPKPRWLKTRPPGGPVFARLSSRLRTRNLHTVCEGARCPNAAECWESGTATVLLMGDTCTRGCRFCAVPSGIPASPPDPSEPGKTAEIVNLMNLRFVVLTSVNRDDLPDGGSEHFSLAIRTVRGQCPGVKIEALVPDFGGDRTAWARLSSAAPDVLAHNVETVERLSPDVRDRRAGYRLSLDFLAHAKKARAEQLTKTSLMVGLGETSPDLHQAFRDLREAGVDFLTLGQYLQPTKKCLPVREYLPPERFEDLRKEALEYGFRYVASGPLVRSSYRAGRYFFEAKEQTCSAKT